MARLTDRQNGRQEQQHNSTEPHASHVFPQKSLSPTPQFRDDLERQSVGLLVAAVSSFVFPSIGDL
jgi:hypothetical protein